jgi:hypothetical protein
MTLHFRNFLRDDAGAITIDWVALTAGILLMGIMVVYAIFNGGVGVLVNDISSTLASITTDVDTGDTPGFNGEAVAETSDTFDLGDGGTVPIGATVVATGTADGNGVTDAIAVRLENGSHMLLRTADGGPLNSLPPSGSTIAANNSFNLSGGRSLSASSISSSGLVCYAGCGGNEPA